MDKYMNVDQMRDVENQKSITLKNERSDNQQEHMAPESIEVHDHSNEKLDRKFDINDEIKSQDKSLQQQKDNQMKETVRQEPKI